MKSENIKRVTFEEYAKESNFTRKLARKAMDLLLRAGYATIDTDICPIIYAVRYDVEYRVTYSKKGKIINVIGVREVPEKKRKVLESKSIKALMEAYTCNEVIREFSIYDLAEMFPTLLDGAPGNQTTKDKKPKVKWKGYVNG